MRIDAHAADRIADAVMLGSLAPRLTVASMFVSMSGMTTAAAGRDGVAVRVGRAVLV